MAKSFKQLVKKTGNKKTKAIAKKRTKKLIEELKKEQQMKTKKSEPETSQYVFEVRGGFDVDGKLKPLLGASGAIYGFKLPDGRECDLAICLRVEDKKGNEDWIVSEKEMAELGLDGLDYAWSEFKRD
jgi:hypothetical protein